MPNMLSETAEKYLKSINPLAERIGEEINEIKATYETLWNDMTIIEQEQILNDTIIHPQVLLQYSLTLQNLYGKSGCLFENGLKTVLDEHTGVSWRDEHSAPFSWKSRSLLNLCKSSKCVPAIPPLENHPSTLPFTPSSDFRTATSPDLSKDESDNGGTFSNFCAKLKSLPGMNSSSDEKGFLSKMKTNAVTKFQNTLKLVGKGSGPSTGDGEILVTGGGAVIVPCQDKVCHVSKPKGPPPPPPPRVQLQKEAVSAPLLDNNSPPYVESRTSKVNGKTDSDDLSVESKSNEFSPSSGDLLIPKNDDDDSHIVPKTGFDFLDDW